MAGPIRIAILANGSQARNEINKTANTASSKFGSMAKTVGKVGAAGLAIAGVAAVKFGADAVSAASKAQQSIGATQTVFGEFAKSVVNDSNKAASQFGLSANEYRENANLIGSLLKNQGVALDELGGKTKNMVSTASDLAATFGGTTTEAVQALGSAFKGEFDPLERYGISLKASAITADASALAQQKYGKSLEDLSAKQQAALKQQATTAQIQKQSADSAGAFARESDTLAHKQQVLGAQIENVKTKFGNLLLPIMTTVVGFISDNLNPAVKAIGDFMEPVVTKVQELFSGFSSGQGVLGPVMETFKTYGAVLTGTIIPAISNLVSYFVSQLMPVFQDIWNIITTRVIPIFADMAQFVVGTLVPAVVEIVKNVGQKLKPIFETLVDTFRADVLPTIKQLLDKFKEWQPTIEKVITVVVKIIGKVLEFAATILAKVLPPVIEFAGFLFKNVVPAVAEVIEFIVKLIGKVIDFGKKVIDAVKDVVEFVKGLKDKFGEAVDFVKDIPSKVKEALGDLGELLLNAGRELIQGLIDGIQEKFEALKDKVREIAGFIADHFPGSPIKEGPLVSWNNGGAGKRLMDQLIDGMRSRQGAVRSVASSVAGTISTAFGDALKSQLDVARDALEALRQRRTDLIEGLRQQRDDFADFSSFGANAFSAGGDSGKGLKGVAAILDFQAKARAKAEQLSNDVSILIGKGLSNELIEELKSQGSSGAKQIHALSTASAAEIAKLNADAAAESAALQSAGIQAADKVFNDQIAAASTVFDDDLRIMGAHVTGLASAVSALAALEAKPFKQEVKFRFTAQQVSQMQRGREIQLDLDYFHKHGGRGAA